MPEAFCFLYTHLRWMRTWSTHPGVTRGALSKEMVVQTMGAMLLKVEFSAPSVRLYGEGTWAHIHCTLASHSIEFVKNWAHDLSYLPHLPQPSCLPLCPQVFNSYWVLFVLPPENIPPLYFSLHCSWVTSRLGLGDFPPELLQQHPNFSLLQKPVLKKPSTTLGELENSDLLHWHAQRSWHSKLWAPKKEVTGFFIHGQYQGPAPVGSRDSLRRTASANGESKRGEKEAWSSLVYTESQ